MHDAIGSIWAKGNFMTTSVIARANGTCNNLLLGQFHCVSETISFRHVIKAFQGLTSIVSLRVTKDLD